MDQFLNNCTNDLYKVGFHFNVEHGVLILDINGSLNKFMLFF